MKHIPNKIYLNIGCDPKEVKDFSGLSEVTWCADKINDSDIEYQRKPIWHDLRENPNVLLDNNSIVIVMVTDGCTKQPISDNSPLLSDGCFLQQFLLSHGSAASPLSQYALRSHLS